MERIGGALMILTILHFVGDWMLQTEYIQLNKARNPRLRLLHVALYLIPFCAALPFWNSPRSTGIWLAALLVWIAATHYWIDSYLPLYWWRKYIAKDPECESVERFASAFSTPRGMTIYVTMDQGFHLLSLLPAAIALSWR